MSLYAGKTAVVTGGASGIGLGITTHLLSHGGRVVIADLNVLAGTELVKQLNEKYPSPDGTVSAAFHETNVASWESTCALLAYAKEVLGGRIDYFFANAGIAQMREMRSADPTHFGWEGKDGAQLESLASRPPSLAVIRVDLDGVLYSLHAALAYFRAQEKDAEGWRGKFVATGSNASIYPFPNDPLYGASKHGVLGLVRAVGPRVLSEGITVNCFGPSVVATGLAPPEFIAMLEREHRLTPMKTVLDGVDIFINPQSKVTGHIIENCAERCVFRAVPAYMDGAAKANMNEFSDLSVCDAALSLEGLPYTVI